MRHGTQLNLETWQYEALKARAEREGTSLSAVVRRILTEHLQESADWIAGRLDEVTAIAEGPPDLGEDHDSSLYEFSEKRSR